MCYLTCWYLQVAAACRSLTLNYSVLPRSPSALTLTIKVTPAAPARLRRHGEQNRMTRACLGETRCALTSSRRRWVTSWLCHQAKRVSRPVGEAGPGPLFQNVPSVPQTNFLSSAAAILPLLLLSPSVLSCCLSPRTNQQR